MRIATIDPVIFLGNAGGGTGEYQLSNLPNAPVTVTINAPLTPAESILGAWYYPLDNIAALTQFATVGIDWNATEVSITGHGYPGASTRLRIRIVVLIT